jgi:hypothetical protein
MKKFLLAALLIAILISGGMLVSCKTVLIDTDNGPLTTKEYDFTDFTGLDVSAAFELEVTPSDTYKVAVTASQAALDHIKVTKSGSTLKVEMSHWWWFFSWHGTAKVTVTMPELKSLELSGASQGKVRGFKSSQDFDLSLSGASELDIDIETGDFEATLSGASQLAGYLKASSSDIELSGASEANLTGSGGNLILDGSGASHGEFSGFPVNDADIELSGASGAEVDVSGRMDVDLSGASSLEYYGNPILGNLDISGSSDIEHKTTP